MKIRTSTCTLLIPAIVFFAICLFRADALKCFQCSSLEPGCANLSSNDTEFLIECPSNRTFCRKTVHTILDNDKYVRITRACGWELFRTKEDNCYENDDDFKYEKSCQCFTDGCNSANFLATTSPGIVISSIVSVLCLKLVYA